jgi:hypothetical protein
VLECPVTGGVHLANSGEITVLVGGEQEVYQRVEPLLKTMGGQIIYMGKLGNASVVKVVTNMLAFIHLVAAAEAMMVPAKYGVDPDATYRAIRASSGNSFVHETESKLILSGSYNVKFTMDLACKDLGLVNGIADKLGVPLELGSMTETIFKRARGLFGGQAQSPEVARMIEQACHLELRAPGYPPSCWRKTALHALRHAGQAMTASTLKTRKDWAAAAASLSIATGLFIDGRHVPALDGETFDCVNPANGSVLEKMARGQSADVDRCGGQCAAGLERPPLARPGTARACRGVAAICRSGGAPRR